MAVKFKPLSTFALASQPANCGICLGDLDPRNSLGHDTGAIAHAFCSNEIGKWLNLRSVCPICIHPAEIELSLPAKIEKTAKAILRIINYGTSRGVASGVLSRVCLKGVSSFFPIHTYALNGVSAVLSIFGVATFNKAVSKIPSQLLRLAARVSAIGLSYLAIKDSPIQLDNELIATILLALSMTPLYSDILEAENVLEAASRHSKSEHQQVITESCNTCIITGLLLNALQIYKG